MITYDIKATKSETPRDLIWGLISQYLLILHCGTYITTYISSKQMRKNL